MQQHHRTAAPAAAGRPLPRSTIVPRSAPLSRGALAGAVVGSVIGALLIALCAYPFIVRAVRRRRERHGLDLAEMGQVPGGPMIAASQDPDANSYKGSSGSGPDVTATTAPDTTTHHHHPAPSTTAPGPTPSPAIPNGVAVTHGLPSPASSASPVSPISPADPAPRASLPGDAFPPARSPTDQSVQSRSAPRDRDSPRNRSFSDSTRSPSRQLTGLTAAGITEEPESFDQAPSRAGTWKGSIRSIFGRRRSSLQRRESRRSTLESSGTPRSPSFTIDGFLPPPPIQPVQPIHPIDPVALSPAAPPEVRGLAWDYYNDPTLGSGLSQSYFQPAVLPPEHPLASGPLLADPTAAPGFDPSQSVSGGPLTQEPDPLPVGFSRQTTLLQTAPFPGSLQRTDTLPLPEIVSDIPSPPLLNYDTGPSVHPMDLMPPTTFTENAWYLKHGMPSMQNPPPPPAAEPAPSISVPTTTGPAPGQIQADAAKLSTQPCQPDPTPYQSPPPSALEPGSDLYEQQVQEYTNQMLHAAAAEYTTPPPSHGPSADTTPETRLTPFTASPSPPAPLDDVVAPSHMATPLPQLSVGLAPAPGLSMMPSPPSGLSVPYPPSSPGYPAGQLPSPNLSAPRPSPGLSPTPSRRQSPDPSSGRSPGRSPARPEGGFKCEVCGAVKNSYHQFNHHKRYHERPWQCQYEGCERSFGTVTHLKRHINDKHNKTRKFYCTQPDCEYSRNGTKSFPRKDNWKRHMLKKHSIDPQNATDEEYLGDEMEGMMP
ncbi:hypothetical protein VTJ83DRAFT_1798 [Remersonia thermophila]|uniref:C2H2-type domain-containing protein n=1 Tax=Remersonia thermophila TaxID=72144 RepID=A0ABR4DHV1_9PEZI